MTDELAEAMFRAGMNAWENTHDSQNDSDFRAFLAASLNVLAEHLGPQHDGKMRAYGAREITDLAARVEHHDLLILSADMAVQAAIVLEEDQ